MAPISLCFVPTTVLSTFYQSWNWYFLFYVSKIAFYPSSLLYHLIYTFLSGASAISTGTVESDVLKALSQIIDPDFGTDIVSCGFVKDLHINEASGEVS